MAPPRILERFRDLHGVVCFAVVVALLGAHYSGVYDCTKMLHLSYEQPVAPEVGEPLYHTGVDDLWLVLFWVILLTALRVVIQSVFITPLGTADAVAHGRGP